MNLHFLKKNTDVEPKTKLKIRKKAKIRKGNLNEKRREETNENEQGLMNKNFVIEYFDVVLLMKQKKKEKGKKRQKQETKRKQTRKTRRKEERKKERQRKRK